MDPTIAAAIVAGIASVITGWISYRAGKKSKEAEIKLLGAEVIQTQANSDKAEADATETLTTIAINLIKPLSEEIDKLKARVDDLEKAYKKERTQRLALSKRLSDFREGIGKLIEQIKSMGLTPAWTPPPTDETEKDE